MEQPDTGQLSVELFRQESLRYEKVSYPARRGVLHRLSDGELDLWFRLNGQLKYLSGRPPAWQRPWEWLKLTLGDDWIYYSAGDYQGLYELCGEHYLQCPEYARYHPLGERPFAEGWVAGARKKALELLEGLEKAAAGAGGDIAKLYSIVAGRGPSFDWGRSLHGIIGGTIPVLPPDCRHVDYDVVPLVLADGCRYGCRFCCLGTKRPFSVRSKSRILHQIEGLKAMLGEELGNHLGLFVGQEDALAAGWERFTEAASEALERLGLGRGNMKGEPSVFAFASVGALLECTERGWRHLNRLPARLYLNVGLEAAGAEALGVLGKPLRPATVDAAFCRAVDINRHYANVEV
ncbi:MAG: hypothetical protein D6806_18795, partial [Deltaproteobacteria bacterium]